MPPLHHLLFTNAYGAGGEGFRAIALTPAWGREAARLEGWLRGLKPEPGAPPDGDPRGLAANCFRLGGTVYAVLALVDGDFARDEHGRHGGLLVHALVLALDEQRPAGDFGAALVAAGRSFARPTVADRERLDAYLATCRSSDELAVPAFDAAALTATDPGLLEAVCALSAAPAAGAQVVSFPQRYASTLPEELARAASVLPPRLRLGLRWAVGVRPAPGIRFVARPAGGFAGGAGGGMAGGYVRWLTGRLAADRFGEVADLAGDWGIRSWEGLLEAIA